MNHLGHEDEGPDAACPLCDGHEADANNGGLCPHHTTDFTPEQVRTYRANGAQTCPYCGSDNIEGESFEGTGLTSWQNINCLACAGEWQDEHQMVSISGGHSAEHASHPFATDGN